MSRDNADLTHIQVGSRVGQLAGLGTSLAGQTLTWSGVRDYLGTTPVQDDLSQGSCVCTDPGICDLLWGPRPHAPSHPGSPLLPDPLPEDQ